MFNKLLLGGSFFALLGIGLLGGIALAVAGATMKSRSAPSGPAGSSARLIALLAVLWSVAMGLRYLVYLWLSQNLGLWTLFVLTWPVIIAVAPLRAIQPRAFVVACAAAAIVLSLFSFVSGFSIGIAYPPSAVLLVVAGLTAWRLASRGAHLHQRPHEALQG